MPDLIFALQQPAHSHWDNQTVCPKYANVGKWFLGLTQICIARLFHSLALYVYMPVFVSVPISLFLSLFCDSDTAVDISQLALYIRITCQQALQGNILGCVALTDITLHYTTLHYTTLRCTYVYMHVCAVGLCQLHSLVERVFLILSSVLYMFV